MIRLDFQPVAYSPSMALTSPGLSLAFSVPNVTVVRPTAAIGADAGNRAVAGSDGGLYVPDDLTPDPLAYYILAKA